MVITTNRNGKWMDKEEPLVFESSAIRKENVTHMFVGVSHGKRGTMKVDAYKYVKWFCFNFQGKES